MIRFSQGFWQGFIAPLQALKLIAKSPRLLSLVLIPLTINLALYALFFYYGANTVTEYVNLISAKFAQGLPLWLSTAASWLLKLLGWVVLAAVAAVSFTIISSLLCAPFNDGLSREAVRQVYLRRSRPAPASKALPLPLTFSLELKRLSVLLLGSLFAVIVGMIPLLQLPAFGIGAWLIAFEYFGYPISQRSSKLGPVAGFTFKHPARTLGLGTFLMVMMIIPFASIIYIPLAVVGASILFAETEQSR